MDKKGIVLGFDWGYVAGDGKPCRIRRLMTELKYGVQRFKRGYDDSMLRNFCDYLDLLIMEDLHYMINHRRGTPSLYSEQCEAFSDILQEMLGHFEQACNNDLSQSERSEHHGKALEMLRQQYQNLWD